jgi:hypothetical protein
MTFWAKTITKLIWYPFKSRFVEKILSLELKNNCEQIPWYQILFTISS